MSVFLAKEQTSVPPEVDTMREEICPVCGSDDSYVGDKCSVCGFEKPPSIFMDPAGPERQSEQEDQEGVPTMEPGSFRPQLRGDLPLAEALNAAGDLI
jgi:hypothetical protein